MARSEVYQRAEQEIKKARRSGAKELDLSGWMLGGDGLTAIPDAVFELTSLETLILFGNDIRVVSERIRDLPNLKRLSLENNPIEAAPDIPGLHLDWAAYLRCRETLSTENVEGISVWISDDGSVESQGEGTPAVYESLLKLPNLRDLYIGLHSVSGNTKIPRPSPYISELVNGLGHFSGLDSLVIWALLLERVPEGIRRMTQLRTLQMYEAGLSEIPPWLGELEHIERLSLGANDLRDMPNALANLYELETLDLGDNRLTEIPAVVFRMHSLQTLGIQCHQWRGYEGLIKRVPSQILELPHIRRLDTEGQPIETPPPEVVKEGVAAIKNYWRQQQEAGIDYLCEAKLIIIGEAGAGKTSLAMKIHDPEYELKPGEKSTEGIGVIRWGFPCSIHIERDGQEELHTADFAVNIWDFGGQEIYHTTHQFFLTRRSLYVLVADDRKEDTDFNYWLQVVELLSDRSPLLVAQNEKQDRRRDVDLATIRSRFPNFQGAYRTNLATNRGLDELVGAIRRELEHLPHIGTPLPKTWSRVREALEGDPRDYIGLDEYLTICQENGFSRREDKLQLSGYLHDLGICLHFQDDPVLKNTVILKPKWGTDAVYRVLDDHTVLDNRGRFTTADLARIWSEEAYCCMHDELLRLMMKFQLCYQLSDGEAYIAPQLLSPARPAYEWKGRDGLVLRYDYDFMPKGIVTRLIVALNHLIADQDLVWRSGVILAREDSRAEVIEDYARRRITVRVTGMDVTGLLAIVDDQLQRIHASLPRLKYERFLPCNCAVCRAREEPFTYPLSELRDFAAQGDKIQCRISRKLVDAALLIREILPAAAHPPDRLMNEPGIPRQETRSKPEPSALKEVFVSYAWTKESTAVVDAIQGTLAGNAIRFIRDRNDMRYKDSIRNFMTNIGCGKCIVVVLSKKYLESKSCMFEMTEIADHGDMWNRVFPIVLGDADIYDAIGRLHYIKYWEQKRKELDAEMKEVSGEYLDGIREELDLFAKIRSTIAGIVDTLGDMNALTPEQHKGTDFDTLLQALQARLSE